MKKSPILKINIERSNAIVYTKMDRCTMSKKREF